MKKLLLTTTGVLFGAYLFGQSAFQHIQEAPTPLKYHNGSEELGTLSGFRAGGGSGGSVAALGDTIYYDDFSNANAWSIANTNPGTGWQITNNFTGWFFNNPIASSSGGNYAIMENGDPTAGATLQATNIISLSSAVDISAYNSYLILEFEQYFARFVDTFAVEVSGDNVFWTVVEDNTYLGQLTAGGGDPSNNPETRTAYIPPTVGASDSLYVRFRWKDIGTGPNTGVGYSWMVDDLVIREPADNDLWMDDRFFHTTVDTGFHQYYTMIPSNHASLDTLYFGAWIENRGGSAQTNARMEAIIETPLNTTIVRASPNNTMMVAAVDSVTATQPFSFNSGKGVYDISFVAVSDAADDIPTNDSIHYPVEVTDTVYARDRDDNQGLGIWYGSGTQYKVGSLFTIRETDTVTSVSIYFQGTTGVGSLVDINVWDASLTNPVVSNQFISLPASSIGAWTTFDLADTELQPGDYIVGYETYSDSVLWGVDDGTPLPDPLTIFVDPNKTGTWFFTTGSIPMIRMNVKGASCPVIAGSANIVNEATCATSNGVATVTPSGGSGPYIVRWPDGTVNPTNNALAAGIYDVTVTDANFCEGVVQVIMTNQGAPVITAVTPTAAQCFGQANGSLDVTFTGGTGPFSYTWSNASTSPPPLTNIAAGTYSVTIQDANNCETFATGSVTQPAELTVNATSSAPNTANAASNGGTGTVTYSWSGPNGATATGASVTGIDFGTWTVTATDANGCTATSTVDVATGLEEFALSQNVRVFPNPNSGSFQLEFREMSGEYMIDVTNMVGQNIVERKVQVTGNAVIDFNDLNLERGMYLLRVRDEAERTAVHRIVVR